MRKVTQHLRTVARKPSLYAFSKDTISPKYFPVLLVESTVTESLDSKGRLYTQIPWINPSLSDNKQVAAILVEQGGGR